MSCAQRYHFYPAKAAPHATFLEYFEYSKTFSTKFLHSDDVGLIFVRLAAAIRFHFMRTIKVFALKRRIRR